MPTLTTWTRLRWTCWSPRASAPARPERARLFTARGESSAHAALAWQGAPCCRATAAPAHGAKAPPRLIAISRICRGWAWPS